MRPLSLFGLRRMSDGSIRNQPWCRNCRSGAGAEKAGGTTAREESSPAEGSHLTDPSLARTPEAGRHNVAAEIAAALAAGRG
jgi:hypothetical protein